jgi:hypothetical protein
VALAVLVLLALARQVGVAATQTIWAEDAVIFYRYALAHPFWWDLHKAYNGYGQLFPRLVVEVARLAPQRDAAEVIAVCGALSLAALGCLVFHMAGGHIASPLLRALLVASMVLLPAATTELLDNLVNVPWWLFFAAFWALLWRPRSLAGKVLAGLVCLLAVGSDPLVGLLVVLVVARVVAFRDPREHASTLGFVLGLAFQAVVVLQANGEHSFGTATIRGIPTAFASRVGLEWLGGYQGTEQLFAHDKALATALGGALFALVVLTGLLARGSSRQRSLPAAPSPPSSSSLRSSPSPLRPFTVAAAACAAICFAIPVWLRGAGPAMQASAGGFSSRYEVPSVLMVISLVLVIADHFSCQSAPVPIAAPPFAAPPAAGAVHRRPFAHLLPRRSAGSPGRPVRTLVAAVVCAALLVPGWAVDFRDVNERSGGPTWESQLSQAVVFCRVHAPTRRAKLLIDPPGWALVMPCRLIVTH